MNTGGTVKRVSLIILLIVFFLTFLGGRLMAYTTEIVRVGTVALEHYLPAQEASNQKLLFVHSSGHGSWMWKNFLSYFAERGYDSWAINFRGHYLSDPVKDWETVGVNAYLEDIENALKRIGGTVIVVGHSMSGLLILKYAESHQVGGLIVSQSGIPKSLMEKKGIALPGPMAGKGKREITDGAIMPIQDREMVKAMLFDRGNVDEKTVDLVLKMLGKESARVGGEIMQMELTPEKLTAPVYVLGFDAGKIGMKMPVDLNKVLAEEVKAKDYKVIEPGGHNYMLEHNWQDFAQQFEVWINR
jgi:pimeloyl-ACP methyl ester carboxylesterase